MDGSFQSMKCKIKLSTVVVLVRRRAFTTQTAVIEFPLLSRSGVLELSIAKAYESDEECVKHLNYIPDGAKTFELVAKFCYTMKLELMDIE
ncbi:unnamed protein product [Trifolium pratense]|uniref:Uncharacterized protein n=1 Tax=Trifolium pratense TaxID=57577 RepID=A0ACB0JU35_TRIPR|nr:unnamed protein product [Trifolium pratense]